MATDIVLVVADLLSQPPADCLNILVVAIEPRPKLDLMQPCALISCRKNLFTMRPQEALFHDTSTVTDLIIRLPS